MQMKRTLVLLFTFCLQQGFAQTTAANALQRYLHNGDTCFHWELRDEYELTGVHIYDMLLTSQRWRDTVWTHELSVCVPAENKFDGALLLITGGHVKNGIPEWAENDDKSLAAAAEVALANKAIVAVLRQTPNEPLYNGLTEDELISFTLHQFENDNDYTWPLLFPMVKGATRAMDAIQQLADRQLHHPISRFVVSGGSKRGWTTWLTAAMDKRVEAIGPMVIDILNMPVNLDYQLKAWHEYSIQIKDYVNLGIPQTAHTEKGIAITTMVDPYVYRKQLTMPKMIFMGTNDEYWVVDAIKNYYDSIPGRNMLHYVPNAGHKLGDGKQAFTALSAFFGLTLAHKPYPVCSWNVTPAKDAVTITVRTTPDILEGATLWTAGSPDMHFTKASWTSRALGGQHRSQIVVRQDLPASGFQAFYIDLTYRNPNGGTYTQSTRMFVADNNGVKL